DLNDMDALRDGVIHGELNPIDKDLFTAPTIADARRSHLMRVEDAKQNGISVQMPTAKARGRMADPLAVIRNGYNPRAEVMAAYKKEVAQVRKMTRKEA